MLPRRLVGLLLVAAIASALQFGQRSDQSVQVTLGPTAVRGRCC